MQTLLFSRRGRSVIRVWDCHGLGLGSSNPLEIFFHKNEVKSLTVLEPKFLCGAFIEDKVCTLSYEMNCKYCSYRLLTERYRQSICTMRKKNE